MDDSTQNKRAGGRPPKPAGERKRHSFAFRVDDDVRERIQADAEAGGHSIAEDIEFKLRRYADMEFMLKLLTGTSAVERLARAMAGAVRGTLAIKAAHNPTELDEREAVAAAIDHVKHIFCWNGKDDIPVPDGVFTDHDTPVKPRDRSAEARGYIGATGYFDAAVFHMDDEKLDPFVRDQNSNYVMNRWTGDGTEIVARPDIKNVMVNSPGDRAMRATSKSKRRVR